jgi:hypothetical protein
MIKKAVYRSSGRAGPRRGRQGPWHQDCCSRSSTRHAPEYGHPRRSVVCTPLCTANALRTFAAHVHTCTPLAKSAQASHKRQNELRVPSNAGLGPCPRIATHARICSTDFYTCACGGLEDSAKIAKYSDEWCLSPPHRVGELVRKASTHISFDPVTEHIASEMRLVLRSDKGKAGVFCRACLDLPSAACPLPARPPTPEWRGMAGPAPKLPVIRKPGAALLACSRLIRRTAFRSDVGGAEQRSRHWPGSRRTR